MMKADSAVVQWIREVLTKSIVKRLQEDGARAEAISQPTSLVRCGIDRVFRYTGTCPGVRDKIVWSPEHFRWDLILAKPRCDPPAFCKEAELCLAVPAHLTGKDFDKARDRALFDACQAWNYLDGSGKQKIKLPAVSDSIKIDMIEDADADSDQSSQE